ncbi:hypothetical protein TanjilG_29528 [Lupinus angustifolius]|uniref:Metallo-beta-lactamase domain-containing protein n=1 Tax=Lupinus angustifolius TaxID=3871 RepID=A0A4P1R5L1_LUPAN|nr:PREDICTED: ribonuclease Z, chloroplastic-like [Lupinus angustifolius]OIW02752.1 hypothetical protein TanjilG_29528 [Lupinus angustifolius]
MQISLTNSAFKTPQIFPFCQPFISQKPSTHQLSLQQNLHVNALKGSSSYLSDISKAIDHEEQYLQAQQKVNRKGVNLEGITIEGVSVGGQETCIIVPQFKCAFDIGRCPKRAIQQDFVFITNAHLDHIGGLPLYVASRGLYNLKPPTVFVPSWIKEDVEQLIDIYRKLGQVELNVELVALDAGETYEMQNNLVVRPFRTQHVIPSQGYVIYSIRKKLKKEYTHLNENQVEKLKESGEEITDNILSPEVAFTGDTTSDFYHDPLNADALKAKVLITEATFLDDSSSIDHARQYGHTHIFEIMEKGNRISNKAVLLTHFSSRYNIEDIRQAASKLQSKLSAKVVPLTEGFKSKHS